MRRWTKQDHRRARKMFRRYELTGYPLSDSIEWMRDIEVWDLMLATALVRAFEALAASTR